MSKLIPIVFLLCFSLLPVTVNALTFKKGEVLGPDGKVYYGASPEQQEKLIGQFRKISEILSAHFSPETRFLSDQNSAKVQVTQFPTFLQCIPK